MAPDRQAFVLHVLPLLFSLMNLVSYTCGSYISVYLYHALHCKRINGYCLIKILKLFVILSNMHIMHWLGDRKNSVLYLLLNITIIIYYIIVKIYICNSYFLKWPPEYMLMAIC